MQHTVELGRAVLSSPAANFELWLTTLITIPLQDDANVEQQNSASFLDFLSSGHTWIGRKNDIRLDLKLTLRDEPLDDGQLRQLAESIVRAPVWEQLTLQPSLHSDPVSEPGTIQLSIHHACQDSLQEEPRPHRLFANVPAVDVRPPEGFPTATLQTFCVIMDILETRQRPRPGLKRPKTSPSEGKNVQRSSGCPDDHDGKENNFLLSEMEGLAKPSPGPSQGCFPILTLVSKKRKRAKLKAEYSLRTAPGLTNHSTQASKGYKTLITGPPAGHKSMHAPEQAQLELMVDGALRLSVCGGLNKFSNGVKIKANSFRQGLSEIAPAIWRPGYLQSLSQRAHLLPTICRSLNQMACVRVSSMTLKEKMRKLADVPRNTPYDLPYKDIATDKRVVHLPCSTSREMWVHLQRNLQTKPATQMQSFVVSNLVFTQSDSNEMLSEVVQITSTSLNGTNGDNNYGAPDDELLLQEGRTLPMVSQASLPLIQDALKTPKVTQDSDETDDNLLLNMVPFQASLDVDSCGGLEAFTSDPKISGCDSTQNTMSPYATLTKPPLDDYTGSASEYTVPTYSIRLLPVLSEAEQCLDDELLFEGCGGQSKDSAENPMSIHMQEKCGTLPRAG